MNFTKRDLPKKSENLSDWYNKIIISAELADYGLVKGTMIYRPYGFAIWELIQKEIDRAMKEKGVRNAYFPLFIPESLIKKEQSHLEGFSPELAIVTIGGGEELEEKLVVRPTSETIIYEAYSRWIHSWRDLPLMLNQWANVVRWEKRTYLFLRTTEFLWQEGHTAHATHQESQEMVLWAMEMYAKIYRELFALPGYIGKKSESEKFAGADSTLTYETLMPEGKVLQSCTSHDLGQNFSKTFDIKFLDQQGLSQNVWQTSWGFSTRSIGGLIMTHGDDNGLRLPPRLAPIQVIILPVKMEDEILKTAKIIKEKLEIASIRVQIDEANNETLGSKINKWELKGVPLRIELGLREIKDKTITIVRRDTGEKLNFDLEQVVEKTTELLDQIQNNLYSEAENFLKTNTRNVKTYDEFKKTLLENHGFLSAFWCEDEQCEKAIKEETKASTRCLPSDSVVGLTCLNGIQGAEEGAREPYSQYGERVYDEGNEEVRQTGKPYLGSCIYCQKPAKHQWLFGQAY